MALHQALKSLCLDSAWCYAVFWKLKRRSRMVLTWEDGFYEYQSSTNVDGKASFPETGGNTVVQGGARHDIEGQIGLAVAQMSYCVYFMGEGIIGRVAFTGRHQWVFHDGDRSTLATGAGNSVKSGGMREKHPSGWEVQFATGIKTIVVIAVPQGVVQLGSTQMVMENLEWVDHVKSSFGTLQSVSGGIIASELLSEGQGGKAAIIATGMPALNVSSKVSKSKPKQSPLCGTGDSQSTRLQSFAYGFDRQLGTVSQSNTQPPSTAAESMDPSQALHQKPKKTHTFESDESLTSRVPSVANSSSQTFRALSAVSDVDFGSSLTRPISSQCRGVRTDQCGDFRSLDFRNSLAQCSSVDAFGRSLGFKADANMEASLIEQPPISVLPAFSKGLDCRNLNAVPASISEVEMQQSKGGHTGSLKPSGCNTFLNERASGLSGVVVNMGRATACRQDSTGSAVGKSHGTSEFLGHFVIGGSSQIVPPHNDSLMSCRKDGDVFENLVSSAWDSFETYLASVVQEKEKKWDCSFGIGDELSQALGPTFQRSNDKCSSKPLGVEENKVVLEQHTSRATGARELSPAWGSSFVKNEPYFIESKGEPLLDAVVANASCSHHSLSTAADDSFSCRTRSGVKNSQFSPPKTMVTAYEQPRGSSQDCVSQSFIHKGPADCEASVSSQALSKVFIHPQKLNVSTRCSPLKAILSSWSEEMQSIRSDSTQTSQSSKPEDLTKSTRKRARPGESTRPRPKDRQQIQDRVRELREIVPNGSKCSIDALLEKTIKHMLFLQNVTVHAENLKKNGELKDDEGGASWAVELGGEDTGRPPIFVKNLNQPRQLLVEMFCEEKDHFLGIADMIRSLGLTILKGVMESRSDKIWARFVVEANRDVHRVDIMVSLMHLLHVNSSSSSSMTMASQTAPSRSQLGIDSSSTSQTRTLSGFQQPLLHA